MHDVGSVLTAYMHYHVFFSYSGEETVEVDKEPDLNDVMNVVAAKILGKWEMVSIMIYMYM